MLVIERTKVDRNKLFYPLMVLLAWTAFGLFFGTQSYIRDVYIGKGASLPGHIVGWLLCGYSWAALTVPILRFTRRYSLFRFGWSKFLLIQLLSSFPVVLLQLGIYVIISGNLFGTGGHGLWVFYDSVVLEEFRSSFLVYVVIVSLSTGYHRFFGVHGSSDRTEVRGSFSTDLDQAPVTTNGHSSLFLRRIAVKDNGRIIFVDLDDLDWIESYGNYVFLHVPGRRHIFRETMVAMEKKLDPGSFIRIRRSAIVRIDRISELRPGVNGEFDVVLKNGQALTTTRRYRKNLDAIMKS